MRTVTGPTDDVVIVGAGLGRALLRAAARRRGPQRHRARARDRARAAAPASSRLDGFRFDTGPTVLTMPDLIPDAFDGVGEDMDRLARPRARRAALPRLLPGRLAARRALRRRRDGRRDRARDLPGRGRGLPPLRRLRLEALPLRDEATSSTPTSTRPLDLLTANLARLVAIGGFRRLAPKVRQYLNDPRTERLFSFQAMYAGLSPQDALAIYAIIAYMDSVAGVYFPKGGMHALPRGHGRRRREARRDVPLLHRGHPRRDARRPRGRRAHRRRRAHRAPTSSCSTPTCPSRTATCSAGAVVGAPPHVLAVLLPAARRVVGDVHEDRPPQHPLRAQLDERVPRAHRREAAA